MFLRTIVFASVAVVAATQIPALLHTSGVNEAPSAKSEPPPTPQAVSVSPGSFYLEADGRGHFNGTFRINGKSVDGLVDTGASQIAINETTARRLGYGANSLDFRYSVSTANGATQAAQITLDRVEIGTVRVRDVQAMVLKDNALSGMLVGMTFLKKLKSFQVESGRLKLVQ